MIDIARETPVSLADVARRLGVTCKTVRVWARRRTGRRLETAKFGGKRVTTWEAVQKFSLPVEVSPPAPLIITAPQDYQQSMRILKERHGIS